MFTFSRTRLFASISAALTVALAMILANGIPPDPLALVVGVGPMLVGAALAQWLMYPLFNRRAGGIGLVLDLALWLAVIGLAGAFAGTLVLPGAGTVLGPLVTLSLPVQSPLAALIYLCGAALCLWQMRRVDKTAPNPDRDPVPSGIGE